MPALLNMVKVATSTTGSGATPLALGSAEAGFQTMADADAVDGVSYSYTIRDGNDWEMQVGAYTASGNTLSRGTPVDSSNGGARINLSGSAKVFVTPSAGDFGRKLIASATVSAPVADIIFSGIPNNYSSLLIVPKGLGHDYTSGAQNVSLSLSGDGVTFTGAQTIAVTIVHNDVNGWSGGVMIPGYALDSGQLSFYVANSANNAFSSSSGSVRTWRVTGGIRAVRLTPTTGGNFDSGTVELWGLP